MTESIANFVNGLYKLYKEYTAEKPKKTVAVVGYGWAGKAFCDNINYTQYNVTVISNKDYMLNTPKLKNNVYEPLSNFGELYVDKYTNKKPFTIINDQVNTIDTLKNSYDYIVLAVGSVPNDFGIPGVKEYCHFFKTVDDLEKLQSKLEPYSHKNIVIAGAGPASIELAFELKKRYPVTLIEAMPTVLPNFSESMRSAVIEELQKNSITLLLNTPIKEVSSKCYKVKNGIDICIEENIPFDIAIWNCGVKANPLVKDLCKGFGLPVDRNLYLKDNIYAIGDIVASKTNGPPTAQNARQQGKYLAQLFNNDFQGKEYTYQEKCKIIHTTDYVLLEYNEGTYKLPKLFEPLIDLAISILQ